MIGSLRTPFGVFELSLYAMESFFPPIPVGVRVSGVRCQVLGVRMLAVASIGVGSRMWKCRDATFEMGKRCGTRECFGDCGVVFPHFVMFGVANLRVGFRSG